MDIWKVLGIEKTKSQEEIVEAYRTQLAFNNPEENQEGFMQLRQAYDEAMAYANSGEDEYEALLEEAANIYGCFSKRIDLSEWERLLQNPILQQLDTRVDGETKMIYFLMDNYRLSSRIFAMIAEEFQWDKRREELDQHFSPGFFNYVYDVIQNGEYYRMDYFDGDDYADYDLFIEKSMDFAAMMNEDEEKVNALMQEIDAMEIYHPYYVESKVEFYLRHKKLEQALEESQDFAELYPNDLKLLRLRLRVLTRAKNFEEGQALAEHIRSIDEKNREVILFDILKQGEEDIEKAKDAYYDFNREYSYEDDSGEIATLLNEKLVPFLEAKGDDIREMDRVTLAWAYYEQDDLEKSYRYLDQFVPTQEDVPLKYYKLKGYLAVQLGYYPEAIEHIDRWEALRAQEEDKEKEEDKLSPEARERNRINEFVAIYRSKAHAYTMLENTKAAEEYIKKVIDMDPQNLDAYITLSNMYLESGEYEEIVRINTEAMQKNGEIGPLLYLTGLAEYRCGNYSDAIRLLDMALEYMPYLDRIRHYRLLILDGWNYTDEFEKEVEFLRNSTNDSLPTELMRLYEIKLLRMKAEYDDAKKQVEDLVGQMESGTELGGDDQAIIYQEAAWVYQERNEYPQALEYIEKSLRSNPLNRNIELDKGYLLVLSGKYQEADIYYTDLVKRYPTNAVYYIRLAATKAREKDFNAAVQHYREALELEPDRSDIYAYISDVYMNMGDVDSATEYKSLAIEKEPSFTNYYDRAYHYYQIGKITEAYEDILKAKEINPYDSDVLTFAARCNMKLNQYEEAEEHYQKAMAYFDENRYGQNTYMYYAVKMVREKRYEEMIELLTKGIDIFGESGGIWPMLRLAEGYYRVGNIFQADAWYQKAIRMDDSYPEVHYEYAVFLYKTRGIQAGIDYLLGLSRSLLNMVDIQRNIGLFCFMDALDFEKAQQHYQKALDLNKGESSLAFINLYESMWYDLRTKNNKLSDDLTIQRKFFVKKKIQRMESYFTSVVEETEAYYQKYGKYENEHSQHWLSLMAECYFYLGNYEKAEFFANKCVQTPPEDFALYQVSADGLYILGMICELRGEYSKALSYFEEIAACRYDFTLFKEAVNRVKRKMS